MAIEAKPVRVSIFMHRKEGVSEADFHKYWTERHAKVVSDWLQCHGVIKYTQVHTPSWAQQKAKDSISVLPHARYASYDGFVELVMRDEKCFEEARKDPYYDQHVKADEEAFIDVTKSQVVFGWEEVYIEEGKVNEMIATSTSSSGPSNVVTVPLSDNFFKIPLFPVLSHYPENEPAASSLSTYSDRRQYYQPTISHSSKMSDSALIDHLLSSLTIRVSGGPDHDSPLELFHPRLRSYDPLPLRSIPSDAARDGCAIVQDKDIEKTFEAALARETMVAAGEQFAMNNPTFTKDTPNLMQHFRGFLRHIGTQPVTITVSEIVEYMLDSYVTACSSSPPLRFFAWTRSSNTGLVRPTLENFIATRDCFFHHEGHHPYVEATFIQTVLQPTGDLFVGIHYNWNPPDVDFESLQNVYKENRTFYLKPMVHVDHDVHFETELGNLLPWDPVRRQFEGRWPPILASMAGADRLEQYTMPLNMQARVIQTFPGEMYFERTIRLAIPITIKRKPDTCGTHPIIPCSPAVRRPAFSHTTTSPDKFSSTNTTPQSVVDRLPYAVEDTSSPPSYKELDDLLNLKAKRGTPASPLRLNVVSLAHLWEATAPRPEFMDVQCWHMDEDIPFRPASPKDRQHTSRPATPKGPSGETSSNAKRHRAENDTVAGGPSKRKFPDLFTSKHENKVEPVKHELLRVDSGEYIQDGSNEVSPERLQGWREAPEMLNEAEKDELQREIRASFSEFEKRKTKGGVEESCGVGEESELDESLFDA
ncbi:hypothetical protein Q7P37_000783 [Cladosporium fusiforme]